jgi:toxin ParE1/3/4
MEHKLIVSKRAQKEIENAVDFYSEESEVATARFIENLQKFYGDILDRPFQRLRYKNICSIKIRKFPYDLYFFINEEKQNIRILSCFHQKKTKP